MADPRIRIVSLTVTEKGYCHDPATGTLNEAHPDIVHDLGAPHAPTTALGLIVEAIARRRAAGIAPFTVLTCDNLPANGRLVKRLLDRFAALRDPDLGAFVAGEVLCPATMVDRITPATTDEDRARIAASLGVVDAWPIVTEPFSQWVIEDRFAAGRPRWEDAGAEFVERRRALRADEAPAPQRRAFEPRLSRLSRRLRDRFGGDGRRRFRALRARLDGGGDADALACRPSTDLSAYKAALIERFKNPALKHRTWQIAMDGSQKLPQRLLGTIRDCLKLGAPFDRLALGVAGWMRYVTGIDEKGDAIDVRDPLAARLRAIADAAGPDAEAPRAGTARGLRNLRQGSRREPALRRNGDREAWPSL